MLGGGVLLQKLTRFQSYQSCQFHSLDMADIDAGAFLPNSAADDEPFSDEDSVSDGAAEDADLELDPEIDVDEEEEPEVQIEDEDLIDALDAVQNIKLLVDEEALTW